MTEQEITAGDRPHKGAIPKFPAAHCICSPSFGNSYNNRSFIHSIIAKILTCKIFRAYGATYENKYSILGESCNFIIRHTNFSLWRCGQGTVTVMALVGSFIYRFHASLSRRSRLLTNFALILANISYFSVSAYLC